MKWTLAIVTIIFVSLSGLALADEGHHHPPARSTPEFDRLKEALAGTWEGSNPHGMDSTKPATVNYRVTSGNSAIVEDLFPGTPEEMVSVYSLDGNKVSMVHYCMLDNQPKLVLKEHKGDVFSFDFAGGTNVRPGDHHMHALKISILDTNHIREEWSDWDKGKLKDTTTLELTRKG